MGKVVYTTDVAHCGGESCNLRDNCVRYKLFKMWEKRPRYKFAPFVDFPAYNEQTNECDFFKPIE